MFSFDEFRKFHIGQWPLPRIRCVDGFSMSVQANQGAYCSPRKDDADLYTSVEVGFPSMMNVAGPEGLLIPFCDGGGDITESVFGWVPVEIVERIVNEHGGEVMSEERRLFGKVEQLFLEAET